MQKNWNIFRMNFSDCCSLWEEGRAGQGVGVGGLIIQETTELRHNYIVNMPLSLSSLLSDRTMQMFRSDLPSKQETGGDRCEIGSYWGNIWVRLDCLYLCITVILGSSYPSALSHFIGQFKFRNFLNFWATKSHIFADRDNHHIGIEGGAIVESLSVGLSAVTVVWCCKAWHVTRHISSQDSDQDQNWDIVISLLLYTSPNTQINSCLI